MLGQSPARWSSWGMVKKAFKGFDALREILGTLPEEGEKRKRRSSKGQSDAGSDRQPGDRR